LEQWHLTLQDLLALHVELVQLCGDRLRALELKVVEVVPAVGAFMAAALRGDEFNVLFARGTYTGKLHERFLNFFMPRGTMPTIRSSRATLRKPRSSVALMPRR
jgi:hypothetical protein